MKKSELKMTGESFRLTPSSWGETYIMVDEAATADLMTETFEEKCDPDDDPNDRPEDVEIAVDSDGNYYAVTAPRDVRSWGRKTGEVVPEYFRPCQNPAEASDGVAEIYGKWETFDDEDAG